LAIRQGTCNQLSPPVVENCERKCIRCIRTVKITHDEGVKATQGDAVHSDILHPDIRWKVDGITEVIVIQPRSCRAVVEGHGNVGEGNDLPIWQSKIEIEIGRASPDELRPDKAGTANGQKAAWVLVLAVDLRYYVEGRAYLSNEGHVNRLRRDQDVSRVDKT